MIDGQQGDDGHPSSYGGIVLSGPNFSLSLDGPRPLGDTVNVPSCHGNSGCAFHFNNSFFGRYSYFSITANGTTYDSSLFVLHLNLLLLGPVVSQPNPMIANNRYTWSFSAPPGSISLSGDFSISTSQNGPSVYSDSFTGAAIGSATAYAFDSINQNPYGSGVNYTLVPIPEPTPSMTVSTGLALVGLLRLAMRTQQPTICIANVAKENAAVKRGPGLCRRATTIA